MSIDEDDNIILDYWDDDNENETQEDPENEGIASEEE